MESSVPNRFLLLIQLVFFNASSLEEDSAEIESVPVFFFLLGDYLKRLN
jgi:hypothetical protein